MKKIAKILSVILVVVFLGSVLAACDLMGGSTGGGGKGGKGGSGGGKTGDLTPTSIKMLTAIPNYSASKYSASTVSYGDTSEQEEKLTARINEKKADVESGEDVNAVTKIFANTTASEIINRMSVSGLPKEKMIATVDYLSGEESVSLDEIRLLVASGVFDKNNTRGWSFFDDYEYYKQLKDRADETKKDDDEDNVKRQYRNMAGKVFAIDMTGAEFARTVTNELEYATSVTEEMAGAPISTETSGVDTAYDTYAKAELDYETLVYLRAFNQYRNTSTGFSDCVELYGYYYDYNRTSYYSQTDEVFEKQLQYSHQKVYTDAEWWEYMGIQRDSYVNAYRYDYKFYQKYYSKHFQFQDVSERQENFVFGLDQWQGKSYTSEMRQAVSNDNFKGQLAMTDWLWCYNGNQTVMNAYNQANTRYENNKSGSEERQKEGEFYYDIERLKMVEYLLTKMTVTELAQMLRFQVYSYSSEMIESAQGYNKDVVLVENGVKLPEKAIAIIDGLNAAEQIDYAKGKIAAILEQMSSQYGDANVESNAKGASSVAWPTMRQEITDAINYDYLNNSALTTWKARVDRLEELVVKRKWDCGAALDDNTCTRTPNSPHTECEKIYDTDHKISLFMNNYELIIRYMANQLEISFQFHEAANENQTNNYNITETTTTRGASIVRNAGYKGNIELTEVVSIAYEEEQTISIVSGKTFAEAIGLDDEDEINDDKNWWTGATSKPVKATSTVTQSVVATTHTYQYEYTFAGWYLDQEYKYLFDVNDNVKCDLKLYAGYNCTKTRMS